MARATVDLRDGSIPLRPDVRAALRRPLGRALPQARPWRTPRSLRIMVLLNMIAAVAYVTWWLDPAHVGTPVLFMMLAGAEGFNLLHIGGYWWATYVARFAPPPDIRTRFTIDVMITTCGEPMDELRPTVAAAVDMDLAHRTYVLDDAGREEVAAMARSLGAIYIRRDSNAGAKAGNLNNALALTDGDLVAIFDADHAPRRDFLRRLVGYFEDPAVGFVQSPQYYRNAVDNSIARRAYQQQAIFYGPMCRGKNGLGAMFCCGTNAIFRRRTLEDVGGFDRRSIVEDFVTSIRIHRRGWRSVYYPFVLASGLGPATLRAYFRQQFRWARGSVGALATLEPLKPGLGFAQRVQYLLASTFYLIGLVTLIYLSLPVLYLLGGWSPFSEASGSFAFFYLPYIGLALWTIRRGLGGRLGFEHLQYTFGTFPVYGVAGIAALLHLPARFRVTGRAGRSAPPLLGLITIGAVGATLIAMAVGIATRPLDARTVANLSWGAVNIVLLSATARAWIREAAGERRARPLHALEGASGALDVLTPAQLPVLPERALPRPEAAIRRGRVSIPRSPAVQVGIATVAGLFLRLALLTSQSLRLDESRSLAQASMPLGDLIAALSGRNVHVPLYHMMLNGWLKIAPATEWSIRIPSVILGTIAIPLTYLVGRRLVGRRAGVIGAMLAAVAPFWVWHSDEARMYPLLLVLTLTAMLTFLVAIERGGALRWTAYAVTIVLGLYTHYFFVLLIPVQGMYVLFHRKGRRLLVRWLAVAGAAGVAFLPWVRLVLTSRGTVPFEGGGPVEANAYASLGVLAYFTVGYQATTAIAASGAIWPVILMASATRRTLGWLRSPKGLLLIGWLFVPMVSAVVASLLFKPVFVVRYMIGASPALLLLLAWGLSRLRPRMTTAVVSVVLAGMLGLTLFQQVGYGNPMREGLREATSTVLNNATPRDIVGVVPYFYIYPVRYYVGDRRDIIIGSRVVNYAVKQSPGREGANLWIIVGGLTGASGPRALALLDGTFPLEQRYPISVTVEVRRYRLDPFRGAAG